MILNRVVEKRGGENIRVIDLADLRDDPRNFDAMAETLTINFEIVLAVISSETGSWPFTNPALESGCDSDVKGSDTSAGDRLNLGRQAAQHESVQLDLGARIVDVDTDQVPSRVIIQDHAFRHLPALDARVFGEIDVERVSIGVIIDFHERNPRSRKAL